MHPAGYSTSLLFNEISLRQTGEGFMLKHRPSSGFFNNLFLFLTHDMAWFYTDPQRVSVRFAQLAG